jgi:hypothetical protein
MSEKNSKGQNIKPCNYLQTVTNWALYTKTCEFIIEYLILKENQARRKRKYDYMLTCNM